MRQILSINSNNCWRVQRLKKVIFLALKMMNHWVKK